MQDRLPFPHITARTPEEQLMQVKDYLFQFKEELEFILSNISADNLSNELVDKLNSLGAEVKKEAEDRDEQFQQSVLSVSDVFNSPTFKYELAKAIPTFTVNFQTGNLEY
jgi:hypothetical protein